MPAREYLGPVKHVTVVNAKSSTKHIVSLDLRAGFIAAANQATGKTSKQLVELGNAMARSAHNSAATAEINRKQARRAQSATVRSYSGHRRAGGPSGYRRGDRGRNRRYSGGQLRAVLRDDSFFHADSDTIAIINVGELNKKAKQWGRLNFGAGAQGRASGASRKFPLRISNMVVGELGLTLGPQPDFFMPKGGYFVGGTNQRGTGAFYLRGRGPDGDKPVAMRRRGLPFKMRTMGIRAEHFLDAGIAALADPKKGIGPTYIRYVSELVAAGEAKVRPTNSVTFNKVAPAPRKIRRFVTLVDESYQF